MASKITYDDKISLTTSELPRANKCTDDDLNEIKQVVNDNADKLDENTANIEQMQQQIAKLNGTILYEDSTGTLGNVTLSDAAENYNTIEIFYKTSRRSESVKVADFSNKEICLSFTIIANNAAIYLTKEVTISGTTITKNYENQYIVNAGITQTNTIYIYKVVGYK